MKKKCFFTVLLTIGYLLIAFLVQTIVGAIAGMIIGFITGFREGIVNNGVVNQVKLIQKINSIILNNTDIILLFAGILMVVVLWLIYSIGKKSAVKDFGLKRVNKKGLLFGIILGAVIWIIDLTAIEIIYDTGLFKESFKVFNNTTSFLGRNNILINARYILIIGIIIPFCEEFVFRGVLQKTLDKAFSIKIAIIIQAVMFGIFHFNLIQGIYTTFLGIIAGYIAYKYNSIWPSVVIHCINNIFALIGQYISLDFIYEDDLILVSILLVGIYILGSVLKKISGYKIPEEIETINNNVS